ncbi:MAG: hypothetical protein R6V52_06945, partial [Bacteroidales bacterium]
KSIRKTFKERDGRLVMNPGKLADFLYYSNDNQQVPFRLLIATNLFDQYDLTKTQCIELLLMLNDQKNYCKKSFQDFLEKVINQ